TTPLEKLLLSIGSNRSAEIVRIPTKWSVEQLQVRSVPPPSSTAAWLGHLAAARGDARQGRWDTAAEHYEAALAALPAATDDASSSLLIAAMFGIPLQLVDPFLSAWPELATLPLRPVAELITRTTFSHVLLELGENDRAVAELRRAHELSGPTAGVLDGTVAGYLGTLYRAHWRFDDARPRYERALAASVKRPLLSFTGESEELKIFLHLRDIELLGGRGSEALSWSAKALALVRASGDRQRLLSLLLDRAAMLEQADRFDDAFPVVQEALMLAGDDADLSAPILTRLASLQMIRGDHGTAMTTLETAIEQYRTLNRPEAEAEAWAKLAQVYLAVGAFDGYLAAGAKAAALAKTEDSELTRALKEAVEQTRKAAEAGPATAFLNSFDAGVDLLDGGRIMRDQFWPMFDAIVMVSVDPAVLIDSVSMPRAQTSLPFMRDLNALMEGRTRFDAGDISGARERWQKGLESAARGDARTGLLAAIGTTYLKEKNPTEAIRWFQQAVDSLERPLRSMQVPEIMSSYLGRERRWYHDIIIELLLQNGRAEEAFDYSERARARAFLQVAGNRLVPRGGSEALVREAETLRTRIAEAERDPSAAADLAGTRKAFETLLVRIRTSNPEYASMTDVQPLRVEAVRQELPPETTLISYFTSTYGVRAWVMDREQLHYVALPFDPASLDSTIRWASGFRGGTDVRGVTAPSAVDTGAGAAEAAFDLLIKPLRDRIRHRRLIIVPHGRLHYVPFAALRDANSGRYLIEDYTLMLSPSASALRFLRTKETPIDGGALVLGNPESPLGSLDQSELEAATVAQHFGATAYVGERATEELLYRLDGSVDLLHIASHGTYDPAGPLFSYLSLAASGGRDGKLQVHEILSELDLRGVNLVVLSACLTGAGARSGGDDVVGLTRAILYAGSPGVISTLWEVSDRASQLLMERFYCRLLSGIPAADALRDAQLALLNSRAHAHPRFWAAFTMTGDPQGRWQLSPKNCAGSKH
ncbi:MAG TPA: CHAT domain-containing protein, partial [Thermoanaerobaculia bacterium]